MIRAAARKGLTLVELIVAVGLASLLMIAVFRLLDTSLNLWSRGEVQRGLIEQSSSVLNLMARDVRALHNGLQGDVVCEWVPFDADGDGLLERTWPRLRLVRQASAAEIARIRRRALDAERRQAETPEPAEPEAIERAPGSGLLEVIWLARPEPGVKDSSTAVLWRGERLVASDDNTSFFAPGFLRAGGQPSLLALGEVSGGLLWLGFQFATQTSIVHDGWKIGPELEDSAGSWDAWNRERPDAELHEWNGRHAGMPAIENVPLLPRRVRIEVEFERPVDLKRRTRTVDVLEAKTQSFDVEGGDRLPDVGAHILIGPEWMLVTGRNGDRVQVRRGQRGTPRVPHPAGLVVHFGSPVSIEVPVALYNDDWNL